MSCRRLITFASDAVTRYNTEFSIDSLAKAMQSRWQTGIPSTMSHDALRPIGWAWPFAIHVEPGLARLIGFLEVCEPTEHERLLAAYTAYLSKRDEEETREHLPRLKELLAPHLLGDEVTTSSTLASLRGQNLARRAFPEVFADEDKAGLVALSSLEPLAPGVYRFGELALVAHSYFRRSQAHRNNLNEELLSTLEEVSNAPSTRVRIRLDPDLVGLAASYVPPIEHQYWYGPLFSSDLSRIPTGVTRHEASDDQRFYHRISRTEFWWQSRDGEHILEAEEIRDAPTLGSGSTFGCRYVHSMVKEATGQIHHLDGAIREYSEEEMLARLEQSISEAGRRSVYTKLWRVDGELGFDSMKSLVHHHFRDNPLVAEYLEGNTQSDVAEGTDASLTERPHTVPQISYSMRRGEGLQLLLAYYPRRRDGVMVAERTVEPFVHLGSDGTRHGCIPAQVIELDKVLRRHGESLAFPSDSRVISYQDLYFDFPLIRHSNRRALEATLAALQVLVLACKERGLDSCFTLNLSVDSGDRETAISIAGHVDDVAAWLDSAETLPSESAELHGAWLEAIAQRHCNRMSGERRATVLNETGLLVFERERVRRSEIELLDGGKVKLVVDRNNAELIRAATSGALQIRPAYVIETSKCMSCGAEYRTCPCSKLVDRGVGQAIKGFKFAFFFWTDRPADNGPPAVVTTPLHP